MFKALPKKVRLIEVGPRDGLQNEKGLVPTEIKIQYIEKLIAANIQEIELASFVRAEKIPQMQDAEQVVKSILSKHHSKNFYCLVPNLKGLEKAKSSQVKSIAVFTATSEKFNQKNINASIDESLKRIQEVVSAAKQEGLKVRGYISTVFGCPYEGKMAPDKINRPLEKLLSFGVEEISLGDTIGVANPLQIKKTIDHLKKNFDLSKIAMHFHDTRGMALANILTSIEEGIDIFDASSAGLGGCPYAKGASGNVATEDVVNMLHLMGIDTGIDLEKLVEASRFILNFLKHPPSSKYLQGVMG